MEYLGIGPGAHSYNGEVRRWCDQPIEEYVGGVEYGSEELTARDRLNEYVMTSLRRVEGIDLSYIAQRFGRAEAERIERAAKVWLDAKTVIRQGDRLALPTSKFMLSDAVIESFFA